MQYRYYSEMIVIYKTQSLRNVRYVESALIEEYGGDNSIGGGGGPITGPPYYVYIVRR